MKRTVIIPENISDITLAQFLKYEELQKLSLDQVTFDRRKLSIFTGIPYKDTDKIKHTDFERLLNLIDTALSVDVQFINRFTLHGVEYGFIPNFDDITIGEYADMSQYGVDKDTLHNLMAVLFRPIIKKEGDTYQIMPYKGTAEFAEVMKDMPLNCANGALVFFWSLANDLQTATQKYLTQELQRGMRQPNILKISVGTQRLKNWLKMTFSGLRKLKS